MGFSLKSSKLARVQNARELIYNKGQGEINKAKVAIIFCNKDKTKSPVGYEKDDEIVIERVVCTKESKNKFRVNSKIKTSSQIRDLFKSVRLNVDNSNTFFVQQGKVAEIVKFQPKELLTFVEECAGVSYYNSVREQTVKILEQKDPVLQGHFEQMEVL